jgi:polar amino acid transport system permease protein
MVRRLTACDARTRREAMSYTLQFGQVWHYLPYLLAGAWITLQISFLAFWGGMVIGLLGAAGFTYGGRLTARSSAPT